LGVVATDEYYSTGAVSTQHSALSPEAESSTAKDAKGAKELGVMFATASSDFRSEVLVRK